MTTRMHTLTRRHRALRVCRLHTQFAHRLLGWVEGMIHTRTHSHKTANPLQCITESQHAHIHTCGGGVRRVHALAAVPMPLTAMVGWMPMHSSKCSLVAPALRAMARPWGERGGRARQRHTTSPPHQHWCARAMSAGAQRVGRMPCCQCLRRAGCRCGVRALAWC